MVGETMPTRSSQPRAAVAARLRRGYFECRFGQLHVYHAIPGGGGFEEGVSLLALHDESQTGRTFEGLLSLAGADRSAFAPDLPGFGQSDAPAALPTIADHAGAIGDFLDAMRLRQVDVLGCGLGARVALELAARPAVRRLVLMVMPDPGSGAPSPPGSPAGQRPYSVRERLERLAQPLLVLYPPEAARTPGSLVNDVPARARRELPGGGALLATSPRVVFDAIKDFLQS